MIQSIKLWWNTQILGKVVFDAKGIPIDCKGLQVMGTLYCISSEWKDYDYLGRGKYISKQGLTLMVDKKNPYYKVDFQRAMRDFGTSMRRGGL